MDNRDKHDGRSHQRPGTEPVTARSALRFRAVLSTIALVAAVIATIVFTLRALHGSGPGAAPWVIAAITTATALIAAIDLAVIYRRAKEQ
ncbi:hypothetical protein EDD29_3961 [Actinocorallia herbida]|uniref:Uncharacterized protein n=1 Tax=Actinocorallia herbida TaxID=58109 RepID=A0A3N1CYU3_9ACTN|nr:DUF6343 family protein [Actinocorallia herbida]ROO86396.1 hypothetical protein EDD29_3961 [Actinocorallia herbida]